MKLTEKIIWTCLLCVALIFSFGASIMITQNHRHLLDSTIKQNMNMHITQTYSLESKLLQDSLTIETSFGADDLAMQKRASYYLDQFLVYDPQHLASYVISNMENVVLYSSFDAKNIVDITMFQDSSSYHLMDFNGKESLVITSMMQAGNMEYWFSSLYDISQLYHERTIQFQSFLIIDLAMIAISFFFIRFFSTQLTKPIHKLNEISRDIAQGNYRKRTNFTSNDEIGDLSKSFDEMAQVNEETIETLKKNVQQKEEFMGSFSHEIKTPMTAIIGFADMMRSYECDQPTIHTASEFIYTEGKRLEDLSYQLMELLSISSTQIEGKKSAITSLMMQLEKYYQSCSIHTIQFNYEPANVRMQENLIFILLRNLIDNALKASDQSIVQVCGIIQGNHYELRVVDQGQGMSQEQLAQATNPFYRADPSRSRKLGGAGLGLATCKKIAQAHHSELLITSTQHIGTSITFHLEVIL